MTTTEPGRNGDSCALNSALDYRRAGYSILPVKRDGSKKPDRSSWKELETTPLDEQEIRTIWGRENPPGIGILSGRVSGGKELIDFDRDSGRVFCLWRSRVEETCPGIVGRLCIVRTPRPGYHVHYRVADFIVPGSDALACLTAEQEPDPKKRTLIETRGEGGYALAPGSPADCHENGGIYERIGGPPLTAPPIISVEEREVLMEAARSFDQRVSEAYRPRSKAGQDLRPGDDFDLHGWTWPELLEPQGWRVDRESGDVTYWTRPGKDQGVSASTGFCKRQRDGADLLHVFTSSMPPLEPGKSYGKFSFYALTQAEGNWTLAASLLRQQGFGGGSTSGAAAGTRDGAEPDAEATENLIGLIEDRFRHRGLSGPGNDIPIPETPPWPDPPGAEAFHGLAGEIVRTIEPASEADPAALLVQLLVAFGNAIGRSAHFIVESDRHHGNEFGVLVGRTSKARKGTSWGRVHHLMREVEEQWSAERQQTGASSGEGIIWAVRDPIMKRERVKEKGGPISYEDVEADPGIEDKRLLIYEPEFANVLKQTERQGNTLSVILRQGWDGLDLRALTKNSPARSTGPHVSLVGHITADELRRYLTVTETANGFGNRHLWICADRSKELPEGGQLDASAIARLRDALATALAFAKTAGEIRRDEEARCLWREVYGPLSAGKPGLAGALLARGEAHVTRLAMLYALLDRSVVIGAQHLLAAMALWDYAERSVYHVFGDALGDPVADDILRLLRSCPEGATRSELSNFLGRHQTADRIGRSLGQLLQHHLARMERQGTAGRPVERWFAVARGSRK